MLYETSALLLFGVGDWIAALSSENVSRETLLRSAWRWLVAAACSEDVSRETLSFSPGIVWATIRGMFHVKQ